jgi:uncharacterized protein (TIGR00730 family)
MKVKKKQRVKRLFRSAKQELKHATKVHATSQATSSAYRLAFIDQDFLLRRELRAVRLQLELLKPELIQHDAKIKATVVIFGSARIPEPAVAKNCLEIAQALFLKDPQDKSLERHVKIAESLVKKSHYYDEARKLGKLISKEGKDEFGNPFVVVTGGGPGIMEGANRGAHDVHAKNIGLNIVLPMEQGPNPYITPEFCFQFHYFAIRKMHFLIRAKALVIFPGGYGTLDELFETLTLVQTKKIERMPIVLVGKEYWQRVINFQVMVDEGTIDQEDLKLFTFVENADEAWVVIQTFYLALQPTQ